MDQEILDDLDEKILETLISNGKMTAMEIHSLVAKEKNTNRAVIFSRLMRFVEKGYLSIIHSNDDDTKNSFFEINLDRG